MEKNTLRKKREERQKEQLRKHQQQQQQQQNLQFQQSLLQPFPGQRQFTFPYQPQLIQHQQNLLHQQFPLQPLPGQQQSTFSFQPPQIQQPLRSVKAQQDIQRLLQSDQQSTHNTRPEIQISSVLPSPSLPLSPPIQSAPILQQPQPEPTALIPQQPPPALHKQQHEIDKQIYKFEQYLHSPEWRTAVVDAMDIVAKKLGLVEYEEMCKNIKIVQSHMEEIRNQELQHKVITRKKKPTSNNRIYDDDMEPKQDEPHISMDQYDFLILQTRAELYELLTRVQWPIKELGEESLAAIDNMLRIETFMRGYTFVWDLKALNQNELVAQRIVLWRGDITQLKVGAIVNAGNPDLTGCFKPYHKCVDNAVHTRAGPRLRDKCNQFLEERDFKPEPVSFVEKTSGFNLPADNILHTVAPLVREGERPRAELLAACYMNVLTMAAAHNITSVAFCCIGTGEYKYDEEEACQIALRAVQTFLGKPGNSYYIYRVVFVLYTDRAVELYRRYAASIILGQDDLPNDVDIRNQIYPDMVPSSIDTNTHEEYSEKHKISDREYKRRHKLRQQDKPNPPVMTGSLITHHQFIRPAELFEHQRFHSMYNNRIREIVSMMKQPNTSIIVFTGAGISALSGIDYFDTVNFASVFPSMVANGFENHYHVMYSWIKGHFNNALVHFWSYYAMHAYRASYVIPPQQVICRLVHILETLKDYFIYTESTDNTLQRCGCNPEKLYTPDGSYAHFQCREAACRHVFPIKDGEKIINLLETVDQQQLMCEAADIPSCPKCNNSNVFFNINLGDWFNSEPYQQQLLAFQRFEAKCRQPDSRVLVLALGTSRNTGLHDRIDSFVRNTPGSHIVRMDYDGKRVPKIEGNASSTTIDYNLHDCINDLYRAYFY